MQVHHGSEGRIGRWRNACLALCLERLKDQLLFIDKMSGTVTAQFVVITEDVEAKIEYQELGTE